MGNEQNKGEDLAPGTWVTETTGFASVPPRAQSDLAVCVEEAKREDSGPESPVSNDPETEDHRP